MEDREKLAVADYKINSIWHDMMEIEADPGGYVSGARGKLEQAMEDISEAIANIAAKD